MLNFLDKSFFVGLREHVVFHYFGNGVLVDFLQKTICFLSLKQMEAVQFCDGKARSSELMEKISKLNLNAEETIGFFYQKGIIVFREEAFESNFKISGVLGKYYPKEIAIEVTSICNYYCPFCYKNATSKGDFISDEVINKLVSTIRGNTKSLIITGGEPTLHPRLEWIISVLTEFADVAMVTNGSILYTMNPDIIKKLNTIQFSIYGRDNTEYKKLTGVADGFDRLVKSLQMAKDNHIPFYASLTLSESTFEYAEEFIQTAIDLGVKNLVIGVAECFGRGMHTKDTEETIQQKTDEVLRKIVQYKHKYRDQILLMLHNISTDHIDSHEDIVDNVFGHTMNCGCGSEFMVLAQNGKYRPCQSLPEEFFSIDSENALTEHINGDFHLAQLYEGAKKFYEINRLNEKNNGPCSGLDSIYYR